MTSSRWISVRSLGVFALLMALVTAAHPIHAGAVAPGITSTLVNFAGGGTAQANQVARFDTAGNGIDAEEGQIAEFADPGAGGAISYVLYGESHACGFQWAFAGTPFCGFNAYTSTDMVHWTYRGKLFDPNGSLGAAASSAKNHTSTTTWQSQCNGGATGCFRPHVIFNANTGKFVLWFYSAGMQQYYVLTSSSPYGGFVLSKDGPYVDPSPIQGDHYLFVDPTSTASPPAAYIAHAFYGGPSPNTITIDIQRLNDTYDGVTGPSYPTYAEATQEVYPGDRGVEAPAMFERTVNGTPVYFVTYSDPHCGYGLACGAAYMWALSPTGPWGPGPVDTARAPVPPAQPGDGTYALQPGTMLNTTSCGGQPTAVTPYTQRDGTTGYLFQSNLNAWTGGTANQGTANFYWAPLNFDAAGTPQPFTCTSSTAVSLKFGVVTADPALPSGADQNSLSGSYGAGPCTIGGATGQTSYTQIVTPARSGLLTSVMLTTYMAGTSTAVPNAPLTVSIVPVSGTGSSARPTGGAALASATLTPAPFAANPSASSVAWSMRTLTVSLSGVAVTAGSSIGIQMSSTTTIGCYGLAVSTAGSTNPYTSGVLLTGSGATWSAVPGRSARFVTTATTHRPHR